MELSIIIVNWNSKDYLRGCLNSLRKTPQVPSSEIVVIDSASFDGSGEMLAKEFPEARFIQSEKNLGFAGANNAAVEQSKGEYLLFLNPDTEVVGDAIPMLLAELKRLPKAGSVGCKLLNTDGSLQTSCIQSLPTVMNQFLDSEFLRGLFPKASLWGMEALFTGENKPAAVEAISGACVMARRDVFAAVGGFTLDYFMYVEDVDLSYKISRHGLVNYYVPAAEVVHHGGGSSSKAVSHFSSVMIRDANWKFLRKTRGVLYGWLYRFSMFASAVFRLAFLFPRRLLSPQSTAPSWGKWVAIWRWSFNRKGSVAGSFAFK